ncbi:hypothetical protein HK097_007016 [Rhizophlyctis rosea]|uniref:Uncharacterized protein n=1 Tax=Rhizophlyctis rosea TaxID=64517 RepID=A0AAD5SE16_9FUNG|nr:hypothetical protein HK097_007016 [Rhizophlyctis rosea]
MVVADSEPVMSDYLRYSRPSDYRSSYRYTPPARSVTMGRLSDSGNVETIYTEHSDANGNDGNSESSNTAAPERPSMTIPPPRRHRTNAYPYVHLRPRSAGNPALPSDQAPRAIDVNALLGDETVPSTAGRPSVRIESQVRTWLDEAREASLEDNPSSTTARTEARPRFPRPILHWRPSDPQPPPPAQQPRQQEATPNASPPLPSNDQPLPVYFSSADESPWDRAERALLRVRRAQARLAASETENRRIPPSGQRLLDRWRAYRAESTSTSASADPTTTTTSRRLDSLRTTRPRYTRNALFSPGYDSPVSDPDNEAEDEFINTSPCPDGSSWGSLLATANQLRRRRRSSTSASAWMDSAMGEMRGQLEEKSGKRRRVREVDEPGR